MRSMYTASAILFLLPCGLLFYAWRAVFRSENAPSLPNWRRNTVKIALLIAAVSTVLNIIWNASWLHSGGSPHGMGAGPGIWQSLGLPLVWMLGVALVLSFFGKGKGRILLLAWSVSMYFVFQMIYVLQVD